jgi:RNA polymerase sigma-70 factor (ECF subfamily)
MCAEIQPVRTQTASDDLALVHACKNGDYAAFEEIVKRYDRKLFRIAQYLMHNREDAEDAVQEAFVKAFQHLDQFREDAKFSTWLTRIAMNQSLMMLRKRRSSKEVSLDEDFQSDDGKLPIEIADWAPNPEDLYQATQLREILRKTLQKLGSGLRIVFVLRDIEGFSLEQTAEALGLSVVAVKARTFRARLQLRERLSRYFRRAEEFGQPNPVAVGRPPCASSDISRNTSPTSVANEAAKGAL